MSGGHTGETLFVLITMLRQLDSKRLILVVEGFEDDAVLDGHINETNINVLISGSKIAILRLCDLLHVNHISYAVGLIDRDLDDLTGRSSSYPPNVVATHAYDLVADVLLTNPDLLLRALKSQNRDASRVVESTCSGSISDVVFQLVISLSVLRLLNESFDFGLSFVNFPFFKILNSDYSVKSSEEILVFANIRSSSTVEFSEIEPHLATAMHSINSDRRHCGGHDIIGASIAIMRQGGDKALSKSNLVKSISTAISCNVMVRLPIYKQIENWAASNSSAAFDCSPL